jgi:hypothetical protein
MQLFLSYRRSDAQSAAARLAEALEQRFGAGSVFLDVDDLRLGEEWMRKIREHVEAADVVVAVIGGRWLDELDERGRLMRRDDGYEDVMRVEIETALRFGANVVPVLVDDAQMPQRDALPRAFRPLADRQARALGGASWDRDVDAFAEDLAQLPPPQRRLAPIETAPARPRPTSDTGRIVGHMARGSVVTVLGAGVNAADRSGPWQVGNGGLPDTSELARHLAREFSLDDEADDDDLARVAQELVLTEGRVDLCRTLRELLTTDPVALGPAHRLIAGLPGRLRSDEYGGYQLIVTNNYDTALEQALDEVNEPYDLVVFMAGGDNRGRFVHVPWEGRDAVPIAVPNEYVDLPIDENARLDRTIVVKVHGGLADLGPNATPSRDNFVITEDDYIGYLTRSPIETLIPLQILNKIRDSHFLFLGYHVREWSARVFLQRLWSEQRLEARSWATVESGGDVEKEIWEQFGIDVIDQPFADFLRGLDLELGTPATTA